jgi:hypothetical protein
MVWELWQMDLLQAMSMKAFLVVLPSAYTFTHDVANPTTNVFESLVTNQEKLKIDITENK